MQFMFTNLDLRDKVVLGFLFVFYVFIGLQYDSAVVGKNTWAQKRAAILNPKQEAPKAEIEKPILEPQPIVEEKNESIVEKKKESPKKEEPVKVEPKVEKAPANPVKTEGLKPVRAPQKDQPKAPTEKPKLSPQSTNVQVSGLYGKVEVNGTTVFSTSDIGKTFSNLSSVKTEDNSWIAISTENEGEIIVFPNTNLTVSSSTITLIEGKVYNRSARFATNKINEITVKSTALNPSYVYFTEPGKVRVFAVESDLVIDAFDKTTTIKKGFGTSVFILNKQINLYNLKPAVSDISLNGLEVEWRGQAEAQNYFVLSKISQNGKSFWDLVVTNENWAELLEGKVESISVFYENSFATWSLPAYR
jgi:hypothetical protein